MQTLAWKYGTDYIVKWQRISHSPLSADGGILCAWHAVYKYLHVSDGWSFWELLTK
jgi:hypothetical protein